MQDVVKKRREPMVRFTSDHLGTHCTVFSLCALVRALQGALGKTSGRSYKAAPRQLLQVDESPNSESIALDGGGGAKEAAKVGREALGSAAHVGHHHLFSLLKS